MPDFASILRSIDSEGPPGSGSPPATGGGLRGVLDSIDAEFLPSQQEVVSQAPFDPRAGLNKAERFIADILEDVPFLQDVFTFVGRPLFAVANVAEAAVLGVQGKGQEAFDRLESAALNIAQIPNSLIPGTPSLTDQGDIRTFSNVLETAGVPEGPVLDVPIIGDVSLRGALGFGLDVAADPLTGGRVGALTKAGKEAAKLGGKGLATGAGRRGLQFSTLGEKAGRGLRDLPFVRDLPGFPQRTLERSGSALAEQAAQGQRALFSVYGKPLVRGAPVIDFFDNARRAFMGSRVGQVFNRASNPELLNVASSASRKAGVSSVAHLDKFTDAWSQLSAEAVKRGIDEDAFATSVIFAAERGGIDKATTAQLKTMSRSLMEDYNLSRNESVGALRAVHLMGVDEGMAPLVSALTKFGGDLLESEQAAGVAIAKLADADLHYVTRVLTPEARAVMEARGITPKFKEFFDGFYAKSGSAKKRRVLEGQSIPEVNAWLKRNIEGFEGKLFETDPSVIASTRTARSTFSLTGAEFARGTVSRWGREASQELVDAGWRGFDDIMRENGLTPYQMADQSGSARPLIAEVQAQLIKDGLDPDAAFKQSVAQLTESGQIVPSKLAGTENMMLPPDIVADVARVTQQWMNPATPGRFMSLVDDVTRAWKAGVTVAFPSFHFRNFLSNLWANFLGDVTNPRDYIDSIAIISRRRGGGDLSKVIDLGNGRSITTKELLDNMKAGRALGFGQSTATEVGKAEFREIFKFTKEGESLAKKAVAAPARVAAAPIRTILQSGRLAGEAIEDSAKIAHVLNKLRKGATMDEAIISAKRYLFDYGDLTSFEKNVLRRAVPFYTWMRKNLPLQIESLLTKPGKIAAVGKFQRWIQQGAENELGAVDTTLIPEWERRRIFGAQTTEDDGLRTVSGFGIGLEDLAIFDRPGLDFLSALNPLIKAPLQAAVGRDFFRDIPLDRSEMAPSILRYFPQAFQDAIDFRAVKSRDGSVRWFRANPLALNALGALPLTGPFSRGLQVASRVERDGAVGGDTGDTTLERLAESRDVTGVRVTTKNRLELMKQHEVTMLQHALDDLQERQRAGQVNKFERFTMRRDGILRTDPRFREARALTRQVNKIIKRLGVIRNRRGALRGGIGR